MKTLDELISEQEEKFSRFSKFVTEDDSSLVDGAYVAILAYDVIIAMQKTQQHLLSVPSYLVTKAN